MQFLLKILDLDALLLDEVQLGLVDLGALSAIAVPIASSISTHVHLRVEICDLMRVLAWRWYFDRAAPIVVVVAQGKGQLLQLDLL